MKLSFENWILKSLETGECIPANVPGDITVDMLAAGKIKDPHYALNHNEVCRKIVEQDFEYSTTFDFDKDVDLETQQVYLTFKGVDLFSEIRLNGMLIGKTENMFREYKYDVSNLLKKKENLLQVKMISTVKEMEKIDCKDYFGTFNTPRVLLRKEQCAFSWDWAADIPGYGLWEEVFLSVENKDRIEDVCYRAGANKKVAFLVEFNYCYRSFFDYDGNWVEVVNPYDDELRITLSGKPGGGFVDEMVKSVKVRAKKQVLTFDCPNAELWWPCGYGEQPLYAYKVELLREGKVVSCKDGYLAYRSVELEEEPLLDEMVGYQLKINGKNVFLKGSKWVPIDCFTGAIDPEKYVRLLEQAKRANFNVLRIWGGGIYEKDVFYETCDKLGIMVWQDFMFACSDIPEDEADWVKNTVEECEYQIKRLRNYPSIVYWCGGNEKTGSFSGEPAYGDRFVDITLRGLVGYLDGTRPYACQSPCGWTEIRSDKNSGDAHAGAYVYAVRNDTSYYRDYVSDEPIGALLSENASMGPNSRAFYEKIFPQDKLWPMNEMWEDRMVCNPYAAEDCRGFFCYFEEKFASDIYGELTDLDDFIAKGMLAHAEIMKCEIEYLRAYKGMTTGFMNWMYSDIWPTATWSVVDYYTEPKQVYYQMMHSFAPVLMTFIQDQEKNVALVGVNDTLEEKQVEFEYGLKKLSGEIVWKKNGTVTLDTISAFREKIDEQVLTDNAYLYVTYTVDGEKKTEIFSLNLWKTCQFESDYDVEISTNKNTAIVKVKANKFVKSLFVSFPENGEYDYSDNYIDVEAGMEKTIIVTSKNPIQADKMMITDFAKATRK